MCQQVCEAYALPFINFDTNKLTKMVKYVGNLMAIVSAKYGERRPLLILLDSLDQLTPDVTTLNMTWLPKLTPPGVKLIVSTLPETPSGAYLKNLKEHLGKQVTYFVEIVPGGKSGKCKFRFSAIFIMNFRSFLFHNLQLFDSSKDTTSDHIPP